MSGRRIFLRLFFLFAGAVAIGAAGYYGYEEYRAVRASVAADAAREQQIADTRAAITSALEGKGINALEIARGFWYIATDEYGDQSVAYFDPDQLSLLPGWTPQSIAALASTLASSTRVDRSSMRDVPSSQLPANLQFHNALYDTPNETPGSFQATQAELEAAYQKGAATAEQLWELSYMYELQGDYAKRDKANAASCKLYKQRCAGNIPITIAGTVVDTAGRPVQGAAVSLLSHPEVAPVQTDAAGAYRIKLSALAMEKMRVSAVKRNFTDGVESAIVVGPGKSTYQLDPIVLTSPIVIVTLDTDKHTVTDPHDLANPDGSFVLHATSSTYEIPAGAIVHKDGTPYHGSVDVYIYEFTRDTVPASLVTLDTFNTVIGYAGNLMQTLGMPFIQFFSPSGEELAVLKSRPMLLTYHIPGMRDMLTNFYDRPEGPLTQDQLQTIVAASQGDPGFPITADFLYKHEISTFPAFWVFDNRKGVWENDGMRLLDTKGTMQAPFYTINDQ